MSDTVIIILAIIITIALGLLYGFGFGVGIAYMIYLGISIPNLVITICASQCCTNLIREYIKCFDEIERL